MSSEPSIRIEGLSKCYQIYDRPVDRLWQLLFGSRRRFHREFWALRELNLEVARGESVGIIGRNGSGKSTLLQMVAGTLNPSRGRVSTQGRVAALLELGSGFNPDFSGRENVFLNGAILGLSRAEIQHRFDEIADFADIGEFMDQPVRTYSSGMLVRLAFSVSVCVDPDILIVDEALAVGDAGFQVKCLDRLRSLTAKGTTLLLVSHDMVIIKNFCDRAIYLAEGVERARGAPLDMAEHYFMDLRDSQRGSGGAAVTVKPFAGTGAGNAFGNALGHVTGARFTATDSTLAIINYGDEVRLEIEAIFAPQVSHPVITLHLQDQRLLTLGGASFALRQGASMEADLHKLTVCFRANLTSGNYYVTARLENRMSPERAELIDKQVGLFALTVIEPEQRFIGPFDLGMRRVEVGVS